MKLDVKYQYNVLDQGGAIEMVSKIMIFGLSGPHI
jgi:hypothetical protein